jgi:ABC-type sugar transport system ATPase subunit
VRGPPSTQRWRAEHGLLANSLRFLGKRCAEFAGKPLTVGIRPEDLQPSAPDDAFIEGEVELVEDLGSDKFVHLTCGGRRLISRLPPNVTVNRGDPLRLATDSKKLHVFHQGKRFA